MRDRRMAGFNGGCYTLAHQLRGAMVRVERERRVDVFDCLKIPGIRGLWPAIGSSRIVQLHDRLAPVQGKFHTNWRNA